MVCGYLCNHRLMHGGGVVWRSSTGIATVFISPRSRIPVHRRSAGPGQLPGPAFWAAFSAFCHGDHPAAVGTMAALPA